MPLDREGLLAFLQAVDRELKREIVLVAVGGTAMTLLDVKPSTIDIDFTVPGEDYEEFQRALKAVPHGFKIDCWKDGKVFSQLLPEDYLEKSVGVAKMKSVELRALQPVDIVVTKIGRLDEKDEQDIEACIRKFGLKGKQIAERASQVDYVGRDENYKYHLRLVMEKFFRKR
ncbi:MAG: hypothetical protein FJZ49_06270 [Candidatus Verstraetearchaeota archaeon]|nr:hypothetical protein [Candidatus Verstraetearchaeota archaeon]